MSVSLDEESAGSAIPGSPRGAPIWLLAIVAAVVVAVLAVRLVHAFAAKIAARTRPAFRRYR